MFALLNGVPVVNNPVFRIVLGIALIVIAVALLHSDIILIAIGAFIFVMGLVRAYQVLTGRNKEKEEEEEAR